MRIALGCDHGGLMLKNALIPFLRSMGHTVEDFGTYTEESCDYPDYAAAAAQAVADGDCDRGIVICTTGIGVSIVANKIKGIRCALLSDLNSARMTRLHNDTNMMALGAAVVNQDLAFAIVDAWLSTRFSDEDRHQRRIDKMMSYERGFKKKRRVNKQRRRTSLLSKIITLLISFLLVISLFLTPITTYITSMTDPSRIVNILFSSGIFGADSETPTEEPTGDPSDAPVDDSTGESDTPAAFAYRPAAQTEDETETPAEDSVVPEESTPSTEGSDLPLDMSSLFGSMQDLIGSGIIDEETLNSMLNLPEGTTVDTTKLGEQILGSSAAEALVSAYIADALDAASGTGEAPRLTSETVMELITPHIDELVTIVEDCLPEGTEIDRTALEEATVQALQAALPAIVDALPDASEAAELLSSQVPGMDLALNAIKFIRTGALRALALMAVMILIVALCLFRLPGLRGLLCVGICGIVSGLLCGAIYMLLSMPVLNEFLSTSLGSFSVLVTEFSRDFAHEYAACAVIYGVCGLALTLGTTVLRSLFAAIFYRR